MDFKKEYLEFPSFNPLNYFFFFSAFEDLSVDVFSPSSLGVFMLVHSPTPGGGGESCWVMVWSRPRLTSNNIPLFVTVSWGGVGWVGGGRHHSFFLVKLTLAMAAR